MLRLRHLRLAQSLVTVHDLPQFLARLQAKLGDLGTLLKLALVLLNLEVELHDFLTRVRLRNSLPFVEE